MNETSTSPRFIVFTLSTLSRNQDKLESLLSDGYKIINATSTGEGYIIYVLAKYDE